MFKYRVHEVAKDLNVPNKEVLDALQKYCGDGKKHMTALTEEELGLYMLGIKKQTAEEIEEKFHG